MHQSINRQWEKKDLSLTIDFQGIRIRMKAAPATNERKWSESNLHMYLAEMCSELHDMFDDTGSFAKTIAHRKQFAKHFSLLMQRKRPWKMKNAVGKQKPKTENWKINPKKKYFIF